jgi:RimJ/RimL family protein N-acetyltransferase
MQTFDLKNVLEDRARAGRAWQEFLRAPSLSMGVYHLRAGQADPQQPHTEDEVYYVVSGRARFRAGAAARDVGPGAVLFVPRGEDHRFFDIAEDLTVLVVFAPAEGSSAYPRRLETARLVLTRLTEADLPDLTAMHTDPQVMATLGGLRTPEELAALHRRLFATWEDYGFGLWVARRREDGRFVGRGGLRRVQVGGRDEVEVSYALVPAFWGQGLATELAVAAVRVGFEVLGLPELVCFTLLTNARSRRVMEKAGFRYERDVEHAGLPHALYRLRRESH